MAELWERAEAHIQEALAATEHDCELKKRVGALASVSEVELAALRS